MNKRGYNQYPHEVANDKRFDTNDYETLKIELEFYDMIKDLSKIRRNIF